MARFFRNNTIQYTDPGFTLGAGIVFSVAFWAKQEIAANNKTLFAFKDTAGNARVVIDQNPNNTNLRMVLARSTSSIQFNTYAGAIKLYRWQHWVFTFNGGFVAANGQIYLNGNSSKSAGADGSGSAVTADGDYAIGSTNYWGALQDVHVWNRILTTPEIKFLANGNSGLWLKKGLKFSVPFRGSDVLEYTGRFQISSFSNTAIIADKPLRYPYGINKLRERYKYVQVATGGGQDSTATPQTIYSSVNVFSPTLIVSNSITVTPSLASVSVTTISPSVSSNTSSQANPSVANVGVQVFQPTTIISSSSVATPSLASSTIRVFQPTISTGSSTSSTATPGLSSVSAQAFQPTVLISNSSTANPSVANVAVQVFQPSAFTNSSQSSTATPQLASVSFQVNSPTVVISSSAVVTPSGVAVKLVINSPTIQTGSGVTVTPNLAVTNIVVNQPTLIVRNDSIAQPSRADISIQVFQPTLSTGATSNIVVYILAKSKIEKTIVDKSRIEKCITLKSEI